MWPGARLRAASALTWSALPARRCAKFRGVEFYQFLYTEDNLGDNFWDPGLLGKLPQDAKEAYFRLALELARRVTP